MPHGSADGLHERVAVDGWSCDVLARWAVRLSALITAALFGASALWAYGVVFDSEGQPASLSFTLATVKPGEVGSSILLNAVVRWPSESVGINRGSGVVTSVPFESGNDVRSGQVLYTLNLQPVVIAGGAVPAFRSMSPSTEGPDVMQLQIMLTKGDYFDGVVDGEFDNYTRAAVEKWQRDVGAQVDGIVDAADVIFIPSEFPTRITLDRSILGIGSLLAGGEPIVSKLPPSPSFEMPVTDAQAAIMPTGTRVKVTGPTGQRWIGFVGAQSVNADTQQVQLSLSGRNRRAICESACDTISPLGETRLSTEVITLPKVRGLTVPVAAVTSGPSGLQVIDKAGTSLPVKILGSTNGIAVIEGLREGLSVRISAQP